MAERAPYPEHDKLSLVKESSQTIGAFLDWLGSESPYLIARWAEEDGEEMLVPAYRGINELLAEYFEIDLRTLEKEKEAMLAEMRALRGE